MGVFLRTTIVGAALALAIGAPTDGTTAQQPAGAEQRAKALVAQMTLEEKASQLINSSPAIPRLNIPDYQWWTESLHGLGFEPEATNFPAPIGLAASFDAPLMHRVATTVADEGLAVGDKMVAEGQGMDLGSGRSFFAPNINIDRDPRWGRGQETYGEDPYLTARMGVAYITGVQGPDLNAPRVLATPKHYAVHSGPESTRHVADVRVSLHDMRDTYLPAFRAAVVDGHAGLVMCAYSSVNGQATCANDFLMRDTLRGDWGFKGIFVSDCGAVRDIYSAHKNAPDAVTASAMAVHDGLDLECATESIFDRNSFNQSKNYVDAVKGGKLSEAELDAAVVRLLVGRIETGSLERGSVPKSKPLDIDSPPSRALALKAAEEAIVLLKNDGVLPLKSGSLKVAVVGPLADSRRVLRGNYTARETSQLPSVFDGLKEALPDARVTLVPAGESITDGNVVPTSALQTEDGKPGVTVSYFPFQPDGKPAPKSLMEKFMRAMQGKPASEPVVSRVEPIINNEIFSQPLLPDGGQVVATGYLVPPVSGTYRVGVRTLAGAFQFGDRPVAPIMNGFNPTVLPSLQTVALEGGKRYPFTFTAKVPALQFSELDWQRISAQPEADLANEAKDADVIIAVVGLTSTLESEESSIALPGFKGGDRTSLDLPADQLKLLEAAKATGKKLIVINVSGSAINLDWAKQNANAIVQAWYPGEAGGTALGRIVAGLSNPAGRLPVTFYRDLAQLPAFDDYSMDHRTYRYFDGEPVYPFGYGLSYTRFDYGPVKIKPRGGSMADGIVVETEVTNIGPRAGDEVVQVYLGFPAAPGTPKIALRGFKRISLAPGKKQRVHFELSPRDLSSVSPEGQTQLLKGDYKLFVGGGQPSADSPGKSGKFLIKSTANIPN